jgi:hypothetical protein
VCHAALEETGVKLACNQVTAEAGGRARASIFSRPSSTMSLDRKRLHAGARWLEQNARQQLCTGLATNMQTAQGRRRGGPRSAQGVTEARGAAYVCS